MQAGNWVDDTVPADTCLYTPSNAVVEDAATNAARPNTARKLAAYKSFLRVGTVTLLFLKCVEFKVARPGPLTEPSELELELIGIVGGGKGLLH